jgi:hypothetical protein
MKGLSSLDFHSGYALVARDMPLFEIGIFFGVWLSAEMVEVGKACT